MKIDLEPLVLSDVKIGSRLAIYLSPEPRLVYVRRIVELEDRKVITEGVGKLTGVIAISNGTGKELLTQSLENLYALPPFLDITQVSFISK